MARRRTRLRLRAAFLQAAWLAFLVLLDLACRRVLGPDYFQRAGLAGMSIAMFLAMAPFSTAAARRQHRHKAASHDSFMRRHRAKMAARS